jgi:hypothetical protein
MYVFMSRCTPIAEIFVMIHIYKVGLYNFERLLLEYLLYKICTSLTGKHLFCFESKYFFYNYSWVFDICSLEDICERFLLFRRWESTSLRDLWASCPSPASSTSGTCSSCSSGTRRFLYTSSRGGGGWSRPVIICLMIIVYLWRVGGGGGG